MDIEILNECEETGLKAGIVVATEVKTGPTPEPLLLRLKSLVEERAKQDFPPPKLKAGIRDLLKKSGFKPSGRNKPASEYLAQAARENRFPLINNLVDINNYISLLFGLPVSLLDIDKTGRKLTLRPGRSGENYVFNKAGQIIELDNLICICAEDGKPLGSPIKDSLEAKITDRTRNIIGVIYSSKVVVTEDELLQATQKFSELLKEYGSAQSTKVIIL